MKKDTQGMRFIQLWFNSQKKGGGALALAEQQQGGPGNEVMGGRDKRREQT